MTDLAQARNKYKPLKPRIIFVAESPPENPERFFYYEHVKSGDALFVNLIRVLYPEYKEEHNGTIERIRADKPNLLKRLQSDGYYLVDALPEPISLKLTTKQRIALIKKRRAAVAAEIRSAVGKDWLNGKDMDKGIVLIKATVFNAFSSYLAKEGLPVLNGTIKVPFPSHGHGNEFMDALHEILAVSDSRYRWATKFVWYDGDIEITRP